MGQSKNKDKNQNVISIPNLVGQVALLNLTQEVENLKKRNREINEMAARSILYALDAKDHYTFGHSVRVAYYSLILGKEMKLNEEELYDLEMASLFHDIGKIGIPDKILLKPTRLDDEEFQEMKKHPVRSAEILKGFDSFQKIVKSIRHHHERFDGTGYPDGLSGNSIPLFARILLIADTFDAMTSSRPYRKGLPFKVAYDELDEFSGSQFDPNLVAAFIAGMKKEEEKKEDTFYLKIIDDNFQKEAA